MRRLKRLWCWLRGYHVMDAAGIGKFRFDQIGDCFDCGPVRKGQMGGLGQQVRIRITFATFSGVFIGLALVHFAIVSQWSNGAFCLGVAAFFMWLATRKTTHHN